MKGIVTTWMTRLNVLVAAALVLSACAGDAPTQAADADAAWHPLGAAVAAPDLGVCSNLAVPAGSRLSFRTYASGVQIYRWSGTSWVFAGPSALLYAAPNGHGVVGDHYAGPTWRTESGGVITGAVVDRCTPDATAIPWLWLRVTSDVGPGPLRGTTSIHRLYTTGGLAPSAPGSEVGEERGVPYTAVYYFYRGE